MAGSTARAIIETPLEYAKIRRQTQQTWQFKKLYTVSMSIVYSYPYIQFTCMILWKLYMILYPFFVQGFSVTWARTLGLMTTYFILVDTGRRHFPDQFNKPLLGPFLTSGVSATLAWWMVWPLEYMKAQVQGGYGK